MGHIPTSKAMQAMGLLASWEEGLVGGVEEGVGEEIFDHVKVTLPLQLYECGSKIG